MIEDLYDKVNAILARMEAEEKKSNIKKKEEKTPED